MEEDQWSRFMQTNLLSTMAEKYLSRIRKHSAKCYRCNVLFCQYQLIEARYSPNSVEERDWAEQQIVKEAARRYQQMADPHNNPLTERERQVLFHIQQGKTNGEIADLIDVSSMGTVSNYIERIKEKTGMKTRKDLRLSGRVL